MKIVQIVTQMEAGGAQRVATLLTEGLRRRGHNAQTWFLYKKRDAYVENSYTHCLWGKRPAGAAWLALTGRLWQGFRSVQPDIVVTHTHSANAFAAPVAALAGVPVRLAVHHNPVDTFSAPMRTADRVAFGLGCYSGMVTVSGGVSQSFAHHGESYKSRLHRIYNGIADSGDAAPMQVRRHYRIPGNHALLVNVGRLARQKNQAALFALLREIPNASLLLVGEGELRRELHSAAAAMGVLERVRFTGELPSQDVQGILQQADLFILPSLYESFCLAAVEAMQAGVPVLASDLPCLREVLGDEQIYFQPEDTAAMTRLARNLLAAPMRMKTIGQAGKLRAEQFNIERMTGEYECLMAEELLYASRWKSAAHDVSGLKSLGRVPRVHD